MTSASSGTGGPALRHLVVVGGRPAQWRRLDDQQWVDRLADLGKVADHAGVTWLVLRPFGPDSTTAPEPIVTFGPYMVKVGSCEARADIEVDGHRTVIDAARSLLEHGDEISDVSIGGVINAPAMCDPDLVLVLGQGHQLPPSLVWELAYSELVFIDAEWDDLGAHHLAEAIEIYSHRHRRFGGLD